MGKTKFGAKHLSLIQNHWLVIFSPMDGGAWMMNHGSWFKDDGLLMFDDGWWKMDESTDSTEITETTETTVSTKIQNVQKVPKKTFWWDILMRLIDDTFLLKHLDETC